MDLHPLTPPPCVTVIQNLPPCITSQETTAQRALKWDRTCRWKFGLSYPVLGVKDISIPSPNLAQKVSGGTDRQITWLILEKTKAEKQKDANKNPHFRHPRPSTATDTNINFPKCPSGWLTTADVQESVRRPLNLQLHFPQSHKIPQIPSHLTAPFPMCKL